MDWSDFRLLGAVFGGLCVAFLLSTANTMKARLASVVSGIFFSMLFTEPLIQWAGLEFSVWQYAIAGLLAMTGDRIARRIMAFADVGNIPFGGTKL